MADPTDFGDELPTDDKAQGSLGHIEDHNKITREIAELQDVATQLWEAVPNLRGAVLDTDALPIPGALGDIYNVGDGDLYAWNTVTEAWVFAGNVRGPQGDPGVDAIIPTLEVGELPPPGAALGSLWWVAAGDTVPVEPTYATPALVSVDTEVSASSGGTSIPVTGEAAGDLGIVVIGWRPDGYTLGITTTGWTQYGADIEFSTSYHVRIYTKVLDGTETSFAITTSPNQKLAMSIAIVSGVTGVSSLQESHTSPAATKAAPTVTHTDKFVVVAGWMERGSAPATALTAPTNLTAIDVSYGSGSGTLGVAVGHDMTVNNAGDTYDPGDWVASGGTIAGLVVWTVALPVALV